MYSSGSETKRLRVSTPLAATLSQNRFNTDGLVMKHPHVVGPKQALTKGKEMGELISLHARSWNLKHFGERYFSQLKLTLKLLHKASVWYTVPIETF